MLRRALALALVASVAGCAVDAASGDPTADESSEVKVDTRSPLARKQYDANAAFAMGYAPRCKPSADAARPRVLVTGFGRFMGIESNATGQVVSTLVSMPYPETTPPAAGEVDPPEPQLAVKTTTLDLPGVGPVDICGMVLPVYWDLAAILIAKEAEAFDPSFVMMNGVAGATQPLWLELGATNRAAPLDDGSSQLRPAVGANQDFAKIVEGAPSSEDGRANLLSWNAVATAARAAIEQRSAEVDHGSKLGDLLEGAVFAGFPRSSNTYLCNNVTYVTGWLMGHPGRTVRLMRASPAKPGAINSIPVSIKRDLSKVPRVFVHWPSSMADAHHAAGAEVMKAIVGAQLAAIAHGDMPTPGDNALAAPDLQGGDTF
jgi:pyrrolidone-carboxylate peptidase